MAVFLYPNMRFFAGKEAMKNKIKQIAAAGVFCAFAFVLTNLGNIIPIRFAGFLSFDPKDAMIVMAGFAIGPWAAVGITFACALLELITISTTGIIGFVSFIWGILDAVNIFTGKIAVDAMGIPLSDNI